MIYISKTIILIELYNEKGATGLLKGLKSVFVKFEATEDPLKFTHGPCTINIYRWCDGLKNILISSSLKGHLLRIRSNLPLLKWGLHLVTCFFKFNR